MSTSVFAPAVLKNVSSQSFSFKFPIINYILDRTSSKLLSKLYKTCKYFYLQSNLIIVDEIKILGNQLNIFIDGNLHFTNFNDLKDHKLWITNEIFCDTTELNLLSNVIKIISKIDIQRSIIESAPPLTWKEFEYLAQNVNFLSTNNLKIVECDNETPPLDEIILRVPNAEILDVSPCNITIETFDNLLKLQRNQFFSSISFYELINSMNVEKFYQFLQKFAAPKANVSISHETLEFKTAMEEKLESWEPLSEKPFFQCYVFY